MSLVKSDFGYNVVITAAGSNYAYKLLDYVWVTLDGVDVRFWLAQPGNIKTGEFVPSKNADAVSSMSDAYILSNFDAKWEPTKFKDGDFLISQDQKHAFLYRKEDGIEKVWKLNGNTGAFYSSLASREAEFGKLVKFTRGWGSDGANIENLSAKSQ